MVLMFTRGAMTPILEVNDKTCTLEPILQLGATNAMMKKNCWGGSDGDSTNQEGEWTFSLPTVFQILSRIL